MDPTTMVIIASVAGALAIILFVASHMADTGKSALAILGGAFVAGTLAAGMAVLAVTTVNEADKTWTETESTKIASMANASEVNGKSGVFITRIEEKNVIRYVHDRDDGAYSLEEVDADKALIREDAKAGSARMGREECTRDGIDGSLFSCGSRHVFHVPKGTVSTDFAVDPGK